jgi:hypothetical protein
MSKKLDWIKAGQTVTADKMEEAKDLPATAKDELWIGRTLNRAAVEVITAAIKKKSARKKKEGE